ncbi:hypothetical protein NQ315_009056 [Exocentrus adspersus]|uniref:RNase H type-1 domain-containing protein n=1 Tax=Exocentrus adspersus TaxID=1586481 RepID=A0AAV8VE13_9CUCU|nr:hypothetical protein NQ315_009056 [Exocentrus adspersus]
MFSDSQAALKTLGSYPCTSKAVWSCQQTVSRVGRNNRLTLVWIPGHVGLKGNEVADSLARRGATLEFIGPEPVVYSQTMSFQLNRLLLSKFEDLCLGIYSKLQLLAG